MEVPNKNIRLIMLAALTGLVIITLASPAMAAISSKTYTSNADFDEGALDGLEHSTVAHQLQLSERQVALPFIWVPNYDGTISKIDTSTGTELGRYRVSGKTNCNPSRTTVDINGNCYVGTREAGTVVKVGLLEAGQYVDRNNNGKCDTCQDSNNDGKITGSEILPWGQDECVMYEVVLIPDHIGVYAPGEYSAYDGNYWGTSPRGLAIDSENNLWASAYSSMKFYYINGETGQIEKTIDTAPYGHSSYGAVIDKNGILWSAALSSHILRINTTADPTDIIMIPLWHTYGMGLDYADHLFVGGSGQLTQIDINNKESPVMWTKSSHAARGVACTADNNIWVAGYDDYGNYNAVSRYDNDGNLLATITGFSSPSGVGVDAAGKVWGTDINTENIFRINPTTNTIELTVPIIGSGGHYTYSDMTGNVARAITTKTGSWTVNFDSGGADTPWGTVSWTADEPDGTSIIVEVRSSNDGNTWSPWETAANGVSLSSTPAGRYLQIKTTLKITSGDISPVLYDLSIEAEKPANNLPVAVVNGPYTGNEGSVITFDATGSYDSDGDSLTYEWDLNNDGEFEISSSEPTTTYTWNDDYTGPVSLRVTDEGGLSATASTTVTVNNVAPEISVINSPIDPVKLGTLITVDSSFTDVGVLDTHTAVWDWGDSSTSDGLVTETAGSGTVSGTHTYPSAGIYEIKLTVTDKDGGSDYSVSKYVVIYDPEGGFVTGGGWINSPAGAYVSDPALTGTANFGFVSKYKKGATVPTGVTQFNFQVADLNFHSGAYDWLVIAGARAQYKGTGTINGEGEYGFMLTAVDGQINGGGGSDKFRIKIWDKASEAVVYDNMLGADDTADLTTKIQGGSITIHK